LNKAYIRIKIESHTKFRSKFFVSQFNFHRRYVLLKYNCNLWKKYFILNGQSFCSYFRILEFSGTGTSTGTVLVHETSTLLLAMASCKWNIFIFMLVKVPPFKFYACNKYFPEPQVDHIKLVTKISILCSILYTTCRQCEVICILNEFFYIQTRKSGRIQFCVVWKISVSFSKKISDLYYKRADKESNFLWKINRFLHQNKFLCNAFLTIWQKNLCKYYSSILEKHLPTVSVDLAKNGSVILFIRSVFIRSDFIR
jgi:hypothetical protein